jgi:hypothetical protein
MELYTIILLGFAYLRGSAKGGREEGLREKCKSGKPSILLLLYNG